MQIQSEAQTLTSDQKPDTEPSFHVRIEITLPIRALKMLYRAQPHLLFVILLSAGAIFAQSAETKPVTKSDIFVALEAAKESVELVAKTNSELVAAVRNRGVDFVLTPEEEWQMEMRDASEELLASIREAIDPVERETRIKANRQQSLYAAFAANYNANDLSSRSSALTAAREFLSLYANDANVAEIVTFMQRNLPRLEQSVAMMEQREAALERARSMAAERQQRTEQERSERDRRRQESSGAASNRQTNSTNANIPNAPNAPANRDVFKEPAPPRQPSDPIVRTQRIPTVRRPM
ncbi:MAG: hypothetical protein ABIR33_11605 [Pyrinomonadaceae bacterium]